MSELRDHLDPTVEAPPFDYNPSSMAQRLRKEEASSKAVWRTFWGDPSAVAVRVAYDMTAH